ncbi:DUF2310 family Zn-ribbon-containing protein [Azotosporobacter soli]|uniref:DUF2310 family Zn-ribbon-containing protein n=1 Tax=Azotosporobacter soli TaxID=3055040 RepID=UPI0031FEFC44
MVVVEIDFHAAQPHTKKEHLVEAIECLLHALRMGGKIIGQEYPLASVPTGYRTYLCAPEETALAQAPTIYEKNFSAALKNLGIEWSWKIIGHDSSSAPLCNCQKVHAYFLYTNYLSLESPLRCGDCFGSIPLYKIPTTKDDEYVDVMTWESDYRACDTLQMNCSTGERFALKELSQANSSLSKRGIDICRRITTLTTVPTYYYLLRSSGRSKKAELQRKCPCCNENWLLKEPLHGLFDFQCNSCRLLSNVTWSL